MPDWTDPLWLAEAHEWIHGHVDGLGAAVVGAIEQPHVRPWSTVMRVPTASGDLWFKANIGALAHEAAVVDLLARLRPEAVPELFAVDLGRGWMLMGDGGVRLREVIEGERDLGRWRELLPRYAELQMDAAGHADAFAALGTPDHRLATLTSSALRTSRPFAMRICVRFELTPTERSWRRPIRSRFGSAGSAAR